MSQHPAGETLESGSLDTWKRITVHYYAAQADTVVRTLLEFTILQQRVLLTVAEQTERLIDLVEAGIE